MSSRPLVVVTRDEGTDKTLSQALLARGLRGFALPTIAIRPVADAAALDAALERVRAGDWIVFTSAHAVTAVAGRPAWGRLRAAEGVRYAAVGEATAAKLASAGASAHVVASAAGARGLVEALEHAGPLGGAQLLWPRSDRARRELADELQERGARLSEVVAYRSESVASPRLHEFRRLLDSGEVAAVAFLSPSSAEGLAAALGRPDLRDLERRVLVASIGPTTSAALRALRAAPGLEAPAPSIDALADALQAALLGVRA
jgi:uroporphyrinogen-III synthase/uroporphyrinogen III methyltransferase/synthase